MHLIGSVDPAIGGPVEALTQLYKVFQANGIDLEVATLDQPDAAYLSLHPFKIHALGRPKGSEQWAKTRIPWVRYRYSKSYSPWLDQNLGRFRMVVIHGLWTYTTWGARGPLKRSNTPYFVFTHGALDPWFRRAYPFKHLIKQLFWWACEGRLLKRARFVLFTTEAERLLSRKAFLDYAVNEKVVRYGVADPPPPSPAQRVAFEAACPTTRGKPYLLYLSRIHPKKGCDLLIQAFASIAGTNPDLRLVMAGPDETRWKPALVKIAQGAGVADRIDWPGPLRDDAKWGAYRGCEAFVLPSHQENFGIVVAEALACGRPVLISDQVNIWREIENCGAGIVAPDTLAGTKNLLRAWASQGPEQSRAQASAARACFLDCFDIKSTSADILGLIRETIAHDDS